MALLHYTRLTTMDTLVRDVIQFVFIIWFVLGNCDALPASGMSGKAATTRHTTSSLGWQRRIDASLRTLGKVSCTDLNLDQRDCTSLKSQPRSNMNAYVAEAGNTADQLVAVFVEKVKGKLNAHEAIIVIDPYPDAHFGHTVLIFVIDKNVKTGKCRTPIGEFYLDERHQPECLQMAQTEACSNRIGQSRKGRRRCEFNHVPLVHRKSDSSLRQQLRCQSNRWGFGACRAHHPTVQDRCLNSGRCSSPYHRNSNGHYPICFQKCDQAVLVSGGWSYYMNQPRHLENMKAMWGYLKSKGYLENNIKIFHANNGSIDFDGDLSTRDIIPATEAGGILWHIRNVCRSGPHCVDTFTIYLNGPTLKNGNLLLWDRNSDGIADGTEMLRIKQLLERLNDCNASWINIIADQNYAGHLVEKVRESHMLGINPVFNKISVYTSSDRRSYTWGRDFTKNWITMDNQWVEDGYFDTGRRLDNVFKDVHQRLPRNKYHVTSFQAPGSNDRTIYGRVGDPVGCAFNRYSLSRLLYPYKRRVSRKTADRRGASGST